VSKFTKQSTPNLDLNVLSHFAQLEYRLGDVERGKTLFEKILQTHPKKTDVWSVYFDASLKYEGIVEARYLFNSCCSIHPMFRKLFQRAVNSNLGDYRTRVFYEKWLNAEEKFGDEESVAIVREHAKETD
jgi:rRNA biogenesis protein RRP5